MKCLSLSENGFLFSLALPMCLFLLAGCMEENPTAAELTPAPSVLADVPEENAGGFVFFETPETTGFPIYLIPDPALSTDEGESLIIFLREPACIPSDFNLLLGFGSDAGDCALTMHTKEWWLPEDLAIAGGPWGAPFGDPDFRAPMQARFEGDDVTVWVVSQADLLAAFADGVLTIVDLEALERVEGTATRLHWVQQNSNRASSTPSQRPNHSVFMGSGSLEDGRSFRFHLEERRGAYNHIDLVIE